MPTPPKKKPPLVRISGDVYKLTVMRVLQADELGRPLLLRVLRDNERMTVQDGDVYLMPYVRAADD